MTEGDGKETSDIYGILGEGGLNNAVKKLIQSNLQTNLLEEMQMRDYVL